MIFELKNIAPIPLIGAFSLTSDVWGKTLQIDSQKNYSIQAPSGTGKTTLTHILYGLRSDFEGAVNFDGVDSGKLDWSEVRKNDVSAVFQDLRLFPNETAWDNVIIKNQLTNHFTNDQIERYFELLGIEGLKDKKAEQLSRGEQQRVAIIRALCMPFKMLLLDEPFSHLDPENTQKAIGIIKECLIQNKAGVVVLNLFEDAYFDYEYKLKLV